MQLEGSRTQANLMAAYAGEAQAAVKYRFYASQAKKDGYEQMARAFEALSRNESVHARIWFACLHQGAVPGTLDNLRDAAAGEHFEWNDMYPQFARTAREEGFPDIANRMELIAGIEKNHGELCDRLATEVKNAEVFRRKEAVEWACASCGYRHGGESAPMACPVCGEPQAFFEERGD
ncbi:MAG: ferritin family protein [Oscillospiraceae bacterium]|nr:ferritin family protein [Oscillospiraceae bacterium]